MNNCDHFRRLLTPLLSLSLLFLVAAACPASAQKQWETIQTPASENLVGIDFPTAATGIVVGEGGLILKSTDGGTTWSERASGTTENLWSVRFIDAATGLACGDGGIIIGTTDGGETWTPRNSGLNDGPVVRSFLFGIHVVNPQKIVVVGGDGEVPAGVVLQSTDRGETWSKVQIPGSLFLDRSHFIDETIGMAVGFALTGGGVIIGTTDGGQTWTSQHTSTALITSVHMFSPDLAVAVGSGGRVYGTTNGGVTWTERSGVASTDLLDIVFQENGHGVIVGDQGTRMTTTDRGLTWSAEPVAGGGALADAQVLPGNRGFIIAGAGGKVYRLITDAGAGLPMEMNEVIARVIPNPVRSSALLEIEGTEHYEALSLMVYDLLGRAVIERPVGDDRIMRLDGNSLARGPYIYVVRSAGEVVSRGRFIVE